MAVGLADGASQAVRALGHGDQVGPSEYTARGRGWQGVGGRGSRRAGPGDRLPPRCTARQEPASQCGPPQRQLNCQRARGTPTGLFAVSPGPGGRGRRGAAGQAAACAGAGSVVKGVSQPVPTGTPPRDLADRGTVACRPSAASRDPVPLHPINAFAPANHAYENRKKAQQTAMSRSSLDLGRAKSSSWSSPAASRRLCPGPSHSASRRPRRQPLPPYNDKPPANHAYERRETAQETDIHRSALDLRREKESGTYGRTVPGSARQEPRPPTLGLRDAPARQWVPHPSGA